MHKLNLFFLISILLVFTSGCATPKIDPNTLKSPDEKAIYELMAARCRALNDKDMDQFRKIYTSDSPELDWIENEGIPMWEQNGMTFSVPSLKKISIVGNDAAATFILNGRNSSGTAFVYQVEALYVKKEGQWKIESTAHR